jgi:hypothetical protein
VLAAWTAPVRFWVDGLLQDEQSELDSLVTMCVKAQGPAESAECCVLRGEGEGPFEASVGVQYRVRVVKIYRPPA